MAKSPKKRRLGRGLSALLGETLSTDPAAGLQSRNLPIEKLPPPTPISRAGPLMMRRWRRSPSRSASRAWYSRYWSGPKYSNPTLYEIVAGERGSARLPARAIARSALRYQGVARRRNARNRTDPKYPA